MNPGRLLEHPIPETTSRSFGSMLRLATACVSALSTPKSPQPGHQSGLVSLLYFDNSSISFLPRQYFLRILHYFVRVQRLSIELKESVRDLETRLGPYHPSHLARVVAFHNQKVPRTF